MKNFEQYVAKLWDKVMALDSRTTSQYLQAHFNEAPMTYLVRKELDSGDVLDRFIASDEQAGIRKINGWAKMAVKLDGGKILQYSDVTDGIRYTLLKMQPLTLEGKQVIVLV